MEPWVGSFGARAEKMARQPVYLDHNASTPLLPEARGALVDALDLSGNPSSVHAQGRALKTLIETARDQVATAAGAQRGQVVFTGSATEAITQAIVGGARALPLDGIVVSAGEHAAVMKAAEASGLPVSVVGLLASGLVDLDSLAARFDTAEARGETLLVCVQWVNNETGVIQPIAAVSARVGASRHFLFVDAVQAFGKLDLDFAASAADMMAVSGHKIGGPAGIGALLVKAHADQVRLIPGGGQELGRRGGTESTATIAGFGAAAETFGRHYDAGRIGGLLAQIEAGLLALSPDCMVFGQAAPRLGNVVNFAVPGIGNAFAMMGLDLAGVAVSAGSACSSGKVGRSPVLAAMGVDPALADCGLRVSLGWNSTEEDVARFLAAFGEIVGRHRTRHGRATIVAAA